jgi:hypothetical protein
MSGRQLAQIGADGPEDIDDWMPKDASGKHWSAKELEIEKYGLLGRLWHGSPAPLKAAAGAPAFAAALGNMTPNSGDEK